MNEPLIRFLTAATVLLTVGLGVAFILRRRFGPAAATIVQRATLAAVVAAALLAPFPTRIAAPLIPLNSREPVASPHVYTVLPPASDPILPAAPAALAKPTASVSVPSQTREIIPLATAAVPWVWAVGAFLGLLYLCIGFHALRRLHQRSLPVTESILAATVARVAEASVVRPPSLRHVPNGGPFLAGVVRPTLYLPTSAMTPKEDVFVAAMFHEMAHLQRRDLLWGLLARLAVVVLWWHPLAWALGRQMEQTAEEACDDAPVRHGVVSVRAYADLLLRLADEPRPALVLTAGVAPFRAEVSRRISRLLTGAPSRSVSRAARVVIAVGGGALTLFAVSLVGRGGASPVGLRSASLSAEQFEQILRSSPHVRGPVNAPVAVIEFTDFQCPACRHAYNNVLAGTFQAGTIRFASRHLPFTEMHPHALPAAIAAEAAAKQGKFWPMYTNLFAGEKTELTDQCLEDCAKKSGCDIERFRADLKDIDLRRSVESDKQLGEGNQIHATPTYLILDRQQGKVKIVIGPRELMQSLKELSKPTPSTTPSLAVSLAGDSYRVQTMPVCTLMGRVVWPDGTPAKGIHVSANLTDPNLSDPKASRQAHGQADTDDKGAFTITDLGPYPYRIQAVDNEHTWVATEFPVVTARPTGIVRVPKLSLTRVGVIEGTVNDAAGQPRPGVRVSCDGPFYSVLGSGAVTDAPETDEAGRFRLLVVPGARTVTLPGSKGDTLVAQTVDVGAGEAKQVLFGGGGRRPPSAEREVLAALDRPVSLTAKDMPVRDAILALFRSAGIGQYEIAPGIGGTVTIELANVPFNKAFSELGDRAKPRFRSQMNNYVYYVRPLPPTGAVVGKVVYPDGKPAAGVYVMAQMNNEDSINGDTDASVDAALVWGGFGRTAADGTFRLDDLGRYRYNISVSLFDPHLPPDEYLEAEERVEWVAAAKEVTPEPEKEATMPPLCLIHGGVIEGTLTDGAGKPLPGVHIGNHGPHLPEASSAVIMVKTDAQGHYHFRVAPGRNLVYIAQNGFPPTEMDVKTSDGGKVVGMGNSQTSAYISVAEGETKKVWFKRQR